MRTELPFQRKLRRMLVAAAIIGPVALARISGKYLPSQLRTQKAGPEPETTGRAGGGGCGSFLKTLAKNGS